MTILSKLRDFFNSPMVGSTTHVTVRKGDSLFLLAKRHLGEGSRWPEIYAINRGAIGNNPDKIYPGTVLMLPRKDKP